MYIWVLMWPYGIVTHLHSHRFKSDHSCTFCFLYGHSLTLHYHSHALGWRRLCTVIGFIFKAIWPVLFWNFLSPGYYKNRTSQEACVICESQRSLNFFCGFPWGERWGEAEDFIAKEDCKLLIVLWNEKYKPTQFIGNIRLLHVLKIYI